MLQIDYRDKRPIYEQLVEQITALIAQGALEPESQLPSVRQLALELSINPNTIQRAYGELEKQGITYSVKGRGSFVAAESAGLNRRRIEARYRQLDGTVRELLTLGESREEICKHLKEKGESA